jgi:hypothetical protein
MEKVFSPWQLLEILNFYKSGQVAPIYCNVIARHEAISLFMARPVEVLCSQLNYHYRPILTFSGTARNIQ